MATAFTEYLTLMNKLNDYLSEQKLIARHDYTAYPQTFSIMPKEDAQMSIFDKEGKPTNEPPVIRFVFGVNQIEIKTQNDVKISEKTLNKIKNACKNVYQTWLQCYFLSLCLRGEEIDFIENIDTVNDMP